MAPQLRCKILLFARVRHTNERASKNTRNFWVASLAYQLRPRVQHPHQTPDTNHHTSYRVTTRPTTWVAWYVTDDSRSSRRRHFDDHDADSVLLYRFVTRERVTAVSSVSQTRGALMSSRINPTCHRSQCDKYRRQRGMPDIEGI